MANDNPFHMHVPTSYVSTAICMHYEGMSIASIRRYLQKEHDVLPSSASINGWIKKYTTMAVNYSRYLHPEVQGIWLIAQMRMQSDGGYVSFVDVIDVGTQFLLASNVSNNHTAKDIQILVEQATMKAGDTPKVIMMDKQSPYFDYVKMALDKDVKYSQVNVITGVESGTNYTERYHNILETRRKGVVRLKSLNSIIKFNEGLLVQYNFFKPGDSPDSKSPAETAKINYSIENWVDVIEQLSPTTMAELLGKLEEGSRSFFEPPPSRTRKKCALGIL